MEKILILDLYPKTSYRISKDTSGGYGTGNDFGSKKFIPRMLKYLMRQNSDWPPMFDCLYLRLFKKQKL